METTVVKKKQVSDMAMYEKIQWSYKKDIDTFVTKVAEEFGLPKQKAANAVASAFSNAKM